MKYILSFCSCLLLLAGCTTFPDQEERSFLSINQNYGEKLANAVKSFNPNASVVVASLANVNNLHQTDGIGRITSEQISSCLVQKGLKVTEVKLRNEIGVSDGRNHDAGEFALSRDLQRIAKEVQADIVVTGTYTYGKFNTFVTLKAIDKNGVIRASYNYSLPATAALD